MSSELLKVVLSHSKIRFLLVLSMSAQILLVVWAYKRRRSSAQPIKRLLWLVTYLAADFAATLSLGNIFNVEVEPQTSDQNSKNKYLLAFWAPFILLHLGRHGKVSAFSVEDNEAWPRHVIKFLLNEIIALFVSIQAFKDGRLLYPSVLLFITGTLKFGERVLALRRGSMDELRSSTLKEPDPGPNIHKLADDHNVLSRNGNPLRPCEPDLEATFQRLPELVQEPCSRDDRVVSLCSAYSYFRKSRGHYADSLSVSYDNIEQREDFLKKDNRSCYELLDMELKFAFDLFFSKSIVSHTIWGWFARLTSLIAVSIAYFLYSGANKGGFLKADVHLTYALLFITLILEIASFSEAALSNQSLVQLGFQDGRFWRYLEREMLVVRDYGKRIRGRITPGQPVQMGQYSLLFFCFRESQSWQWLKPILSFLQLKKIWDNYWNSKFVTFDEHFRNEILDHMRRLARRQTVSVNNASLSHRDWVLLPSEDDSATMNPVLRRSIEKRFEECFLIWHIATDICFLTSQESPDQLKSANILSCYMLHLMVTQAAVRPSIKTLDLASYRNACAAGIQFFCGVEYTHGKTEAYRDLKQKFGTLSDSGKRLGSLLQEGCELAIELEALAHDNGSGIWELVFQVWIELISFAAMECKGRQHAELLGAGWHLITLVWLFMLHSGMACQEGSAAENVHLGETTTVELQPLAQLQTVTIEMQRQDQDEESRPAEELGDETDVTDSKVPSD